MEKKYVVLSKDNDNDKEVKEYRDLTSARKAYGHAVETGTWNNVTLVYEMYDPEHNDADYECIDYWSRALEPVVVGGHNGKIARRVLDDYIDYVSNSLISDLKYGEGYPEKLIAQAQRLEEAEPRLRNLVRVLKAIGSAYSVVDGLIEDDDIRLR